MTTQDIKAKDLTTKAMLVALNIKQWNVNRKDKQATAKLAEDFQSVTGWARGNKSLASKKALSEVNGIVAECRQFHMLNTCPWTDEGYRILPSKNYMFYTDKLREFTARFEVAVQNIKANYPAIIEEAKQSLGTLFNELDYPAISDLDSKYAVNVSVSPLPSSNDFRVTQISDEDIKAIQEQIENRLNEATKGIMADLWSRLYTVVEKAFEAFSDPDMKFHDSKLDNIQETIEILRRLNIDNDLKLERMCKVTEARICSLDPAELRKQPEARQDAAIDAKKLLESLAAFN